MYSCRKKYRKLKIRFDSAMEQSNKLYVDEQKAISLAKRLQEQNELSPTDIAQPAVYRQD